MRFDGPVRWYGAAALASLLVLLAGWFLLVSPQRAAADDISAQAEQQAENNQRTELKIAGLKEQYKTLPTLQEQLAVAQARLPQTPQLPTLLRQLNAAATSSGVILNSVSPGAPTPLSGGPATAGTAGSVSVIPLSIAITGAFSNTEIFLSKLESLPRSLLVTGLTIGRASSSGSASGGTTTTAASNITNPLATTITARVFSATPTLAPATSSTHAAAAPAAPAQ